MKIPSASIQLGCLRNFKRKSDFVRCFSCKQIHQRYKFRILCSVPIFEHTHRFFLFSSFRCCRLAFGNPEVSKALGFAFGSTQPTRTSTIGYYNLFYKGCKVVHIDLGEIQKKKFKNSRSWIRGFEIAAV